MYYYLQREKSIVATNTYMSAFYKICSNISEVIKNHDNDVIFKRGDVLIGNNDFGKYKGELQIALRACGDNRKNLVGRVREEEKILLDFIEPWSKFIFEEYKKGSKS